MIRTNKNSVEIKEARLVWIAAPSETLPLSAFELTDASQKEFDSQKILKQPQQNKNIPQSPTDEHGNEEALNDAERQLKQAYEDAEPAKKQKMEALIENFEKNKSTASLIDLKTLATKKNGRAEMRKFFAKGEVAKTKKLNVDFEKNNDAEWNIGAGDLLPANVRKISVQSVKNGKTLTLRGERAPSENYPHPPRVGYYEKANDPKSYIPIFSGDEITIENVFDTKQMQKLDEDLKKVSNGKNIAEKENSLHKDRLRQTEAREKKMNELREKYGMQETGNLEKDFINLSKAIAQDIEKEFGIPWQVTLAQTALETGMGKHAPQNNFFGIKGFGQKLKTAEVINGREISVVDSFANYKSPLESFLAYAKLLTTSPRYQPIVEAHKKNPLTPKAFLQKIIEAGYATDPFYVSKAENLMNRHGILMNV